MTITLDTSFKKLQTLDSSDKETMDKCFNLLSCVASN